VTCNVCGRAGERDDRVGDTCGRPMDRPFELKSDADFARDVMRFRRGEPLDITRPRCLGTLVGAR
jgi:hypothetical protein